MYTGKRRTDIIRRTGNCLENNVSVRKKTEKKEEHAVKIRFAEYLKTKLLPTLSEADIIVMDNMRFHHAKAVEQLLDSSKVTYLYLPPYSPDLNPIEKMWSKLKAFLRKEKIRMASKLPSAISKGFLTIRPKDCIGWFHSCNYMQ